MTYGGNDDDAGKADCPARGSHDKLIDSSIERKRSFVFVFGGDDDQRGEQASEDDEQEEGRRERERWRKRVALGAKVYIHRARRDLAAVPIPSFSRYRSRPVPVHPAATFIASFRAFCSETSIWAAARLSAQQKTVEPAQPALVLLLPFVFFCWDFWPGITGKG